MKGSHQLISRSAPRTSLIGSGRLIGFQSEMVSRSDTLEMGFVYLAAQLWWRMSPPLARLLWVDDMDVQVIVEGRVCPYAVWLRTDRAISRREFYGVCVRTTGMAGDWMGCTSPRSVSIARCDSTSQPCACRMKPRTRQREQRHEHETTHFGSDDLFFGNISVGMLANDP